MALDVDVKLSIYIPTLKRDGLFGRCLKSIERSIAAAGEDALEHEIVVVEGVSPVGAARNEALRRVTGDWIATVDADDEVEEVWFSEICRAIREAEQSESKIDDIVFDMTIVRQGREFVHRYGRSPVLDATMVVEDVLREMRSIGGHLFRHVSRRNLWVGISFPNVRVMEDAIVLPQVLSKARCVRYVAKPLYRYVERGDSLCSSTSTSLFFQLAVERAEKYGKSAAVGACVAAYNCLYDRVDRGGAARRWIGRHLFMVLLDGEVCVKWKLKFLLATFGIIVRRPSR